MTSYKPGRARYSAEVDVSADIFFDAVADWAGLLTYLPPDAPVKFARLDLVQSSEDKPVPCTRLLHVDKSQFPPEMLHDIPDVFEETLLVADRDTGTIIYRVKDTLGIRNYFAVEEIVSLDGERSRVTISSRFDIGEDEENEVVAGQFIAAYKSMIHGIEAAHCGQISLLHP